MTLASQHASPALRQDKLNVARNATADELEILGVSHSLLRARWRNLYVVRWYGDSTIAELSTVFKEIRQTADRHGTVVVASLLDSGCKPPTPEGRELISKHQAQMGDKLVALANLVDGQGFWASIVLNALLGIQNKKAARQQSERVFRKRDEACTWLAQFVMGNPTDQRLHEVLTECRDPANQVAHGL
jgi:hypothetical protein